eukprot:tig00020960_g16577.t1
MPHASAVHASVAPAPSSSSSGSPEDVCDAAGRSSLQPHLPFQKRLSRSPSLAHLRAILLQPRRWSRGLGLSRPRLGQRSASDPDTTTDSASAAVGARGARGILRSVQRSIAPRQPYRAVWECSVALLTLYYVVAAPFEVAFKYTHLRPPGLVAWELVVDFCLLADCLLHLVAPFEEAAGAAGQGPGPGSGSGSGSQVAVEYRVHRIALRYGRSWLVPDLLSSIPADLIADAGAAKAFRYLKVLRVLRLARLLETVRAHGLLSKLEARTGLYPGAGRFLVLAAAIGLIAHFFCCLQFYAATFEGPGHVDPDSWVVAHGLQDAPVSSQYLICIYWVLTTLTTTGYGDIVPGSDREKAVTLFMFLVGAAVFAFLVGSVTNLAASLDRPAAVYRERLDALAAFLAYHRVPGDLARRIRAFYEHFLRGSLAFNEGALLGDLSPPLRTELALFRHKELLLKSALFRKVADRRFLERVASLLRRATFGPGDQIFFAGERGTEMFFVDRGRVRIAVGEEAAPRTIAVLAPGNFLGEIAVLTASVRTAHAIALGFCELYALSKEDLAGVLHDFPHVQDMFAETAMRRLAENAERDRARLLEEQAALAAAAAAAAAAAKAGADPDREGGARPSAGAGAGPACAPPSAASRPVAAVTERAVRAAEAEDETEAAEAAAAEAAEREQHARDAAEAKAALARAQAQATEAGSGTGPAPVVLQASPRSTPLRRALAHFAHAQAGAAALEAVAEGAACLRPKVRQRMLDTMAEMAAPQRSRLPPMLASVPAPIIAITARASHAPSVLSVPPPSAAAEASQHGSASNTNRVGSDAGADESDDPEDLLLLPSFPSGSASSSGKRPPRVWRAAAGSAAAATAAEVRALVAEQRAARALLEETAAAVRALAAAVERIERRAAGAGAGDGDAAGGAAGGGGGGAGSGGGSGAERESASRSAPAGGEERGRALMASRPAPPADSSPPA